MVGAMVLIVGIALGFGGARALGPRDMPVDIATYEVSPTEITVRVAAGSGAAFTLVLLVERSDRLEVSVREQVSRGFRTADLSFYRFTWRLSEPLGSRPVVNALTGREIPAHTAQASSER